MRHAVGVVSIVLAGLALSSATPALGQCSKRIVVYLDASGSMDVRGKTSQSAFRGSLEAVGRLLDVQGFLGVDDVVEIVPFGEHLQGRYTAHGVGEVGPQLERLRGAAHEEPDTNFDSVLEDVDRLLMGDSVFGRQIVILASDFAHEPRSLSRRRSAVQDWEQVFARWRPRLEGRLGKGSKVPLLLFRALTEGSAATGETREQIQAKVVSDLGAFASEDVLRVGRGGTEAGELAKAIQRKLLAPPEVVARRARNDPRQIELRVTNPNCFPLTLKRIDLRCKGEGGALSDPVSVTIPEAQRKLGPTGSEKATQVIPHDRPTGSCWEKSEDFTALAETEEGEPGQSEGTTGTTLEIKPTQAYIEQWLPWRHVLRLEVELRGQFAGPKSFDIQLREAGRDTAIAEGQFQAPEGLDPDQEKPYRIIFSVRDAVADRLADGDKLLCRLTDGRSQEATVEVRKDDFRSITNGITSIVSVLCVLVALGSLIGKNRSLKRDLPGAVDRAALVDFMGKGLLNLTFLLLPLLLNLFRANLLQRFSLQGLDTLKLFTAVLVAGVASFKVVRAYQQAQLVEEVYKSDQPVDVDRYLRRVERGWSALGWAAAAVVLTASLMVFASLESRPANDVGSKTIPLLHEQE
jgi:hypothetical protein